MRKEYDFSQAKSVKEIPHLQKLQMQFKTEVQIELDNDVIETLKKQADLKGIDYQILINQILRSFTQNIKVNI
jgi:uncharacterized protein (DUF4415 family)